MSLTGEAQPRDQHQHEGGRGYHLERGFTAAFELVATPALLALIGWWLDRRLGTGPVLMIGLAAFTAAYGVWKLLHDYNSVMDRLEDQRIERGIDALLKVDD